MATIKSQVLKEFPDAKLNLSIADGRVYLLKIIDKDKECDIHLREDDAWLDFHSRYCKPIPPINKSNHEEDIENGIDEYLKYLCKVDKYNEEHLRSSVERYFKAGVNWYKEQLNKK